MLVGGAPESVLLMRPVTLARLKGVLETAERLDRGDRGVGVAAIVVGVGGDADIADIQHIAAAAGIEQDIAFDDAAIVDDGVAGRAGQKIDRQRVVHHRGIGGRRLHRGQRSDQARIVDQPDAAGLIRIAVDVWLKGEEVGALMDVGEIVLVRTLAEIVPCCRTSICGTTA